MPISFSSICEFRRVYHQLVSDSGWLPVQVLIGGHEYAVDALSKTVSAVPNTESQPRSFGRIVSDFFVRNIERERRELRSILFGPETMVSYIALTPNAEELASNIQIQIVSCIGKLMHDHGPDHQSLESKLQWLIKILLDMQQRMEHPGQRIRMLASMQNYLKSCLDDLGADHSARAALNGAIQCLREEVRSLILRPKYDSSLITMESSASKLDSALKTHEDELCEMRSEWTEKHCLIIPQQSHRDLPRLNFRLNGDKGFDSINWLREHHCQPGNTIEWEAVRQKMEQLVLEFFADMPTEVAMETIVRLSQTEFNSLYAVLVDFVHKSLPGWGLLGKQRTDLMIEVAHNNGVVTMDYALCFQPCFSGGAAGPEENMVHYNEHSSISVGSQIVITADAKPEYGPVQVRIKLDEGVLS